jgi:hypothetical protein
VRYRLIPLYGGLGAGKMEWYALWVRGRSADKLATRLEAATERMGPVKDAKGKGVPREMVAWAPSKRVSKWSRRCDGDAVAHSGA